MKKLTLYALISMILALNGCRSGIQCEPSSPPDFTIIVKNVKGEDLLNPKTDGYFEKDSIIMLDEKNQEVALSIDNPTKIGEKSPVFFKIIKKADDQTGLHTFIIKWNKQLSDTLGVVTKMQTGSICPAIVYSRVVHQKKDLISDKTTFNDAFILVK
jgi:hypothetical protein